MGFETQPAESPDLLAWDGTYRESEYHKLKPGQWTDDTMMAKLLSESLMSCCGFYPRDVSDRYLVWLRRGEHRGMGKTTHAALTRIHEGTPWTDSGIQGAEGNGTAMRVAPIGLFFREDIPTVREFSRLDARITHSSLEAEAGSAAVAVAIAMLATRKADRQSLIAQASEWVIDSRVQRGLHLVDEMRTLSVPVAEALRRVGTKPHVVQTVPAAFAAFTMTTSFKDAVEAAVRAGGDTDTTAAITGALAGTFYGLDAIPTYYKEGLEEFRHLRRLEKTLQEGPRTSILWKL